MDLLELYGCSGVPNLPSDQEPRGHGAKEQFEGTPRGEVDQERILDADRSESKCFRVGQERSKVFN